MNLQRFSQTYPTLYHMAEAGTWSSIKKHGLLSTTAALDLVGLNGDERLALEERHRPEDAVIGFGGRSFVLRDQKPIPPERIAKALVDGSTPEDWYKFLNGKVFMWAEEHRLLGLLNARSYRDRPHDVLSIDTASLVAKYAPRISLCRMNSGNALPFGHKRGRSDFMAIEAYPENRAGGPAKAVVEVVVDYAIPDIRRFVTNVRRMEGDHVLADVPL